MRFLHVTFVLSIAFLVGACASPEAVADLHADHPVSASASAAPFDSRLAEDLESSAELEPGVTSAAAPAVHDQGHLGAVVRDGDALSSALSAYLDISELLAADSVDALEERGRALAQSLQAALGESAGDGIVAHADALSAAAGIAQAREHFGELSPIMVELLKASNVETEGVYRFVCGMADAPGGGIWLQRGSEARNPYFGSMMLRCARESAPFESAMSTHSHDA